MYPKRKLLPLLAALCFVLAVFSGGTAVFAAGGALTGDGSADSPYEISDTSDLQAFAKLVNEGNSGACAVLTAAINIGGNAGSPWTCIGTDNMLKYDGIFDGNGYEISGLYIHSSKSYQGLFGYVGNNAIIKNLKVSGEVTSTTQQAGGIAGHSKGRIINCTSAVDVSGKTAIGGIVGWNTGVVKQCSYHTGTVADEGSYSGGIVGYNEGSISYSYNTGTIKGTNYVGGVVGSNGGTTENCYNIGEVTGTKSVGGVVGFKFGTAANCYFLSNHPTGEIKNDGTGKTAEQFASGEVTWSLNNGITDGTQMFYQTCGEGIPAFTGRTVYQTTSYRCPGDPVGAKIYSNTSQAVTGEHSFTNETVSDSYLKSPGTCSAEAVYYKSCSICSEASPSDTFLGNKNASNHTGLIKTEAKAATHLEAGNIEYWHCEDCGRYFRDAEGTLEITLADTETDRLTEHTPDGTGWHSDESRHWNTCECGERINSAAHTYTWVTDKNATETETGLKHEECTICSHKKEAVEIPATGTPTDPSDNPAPETGDTTNPALWITLFAAAGAGLAASAIYTKKKKWSR